MREWRAIPGWEHYQASDQGEIKSLGRWRQSVRYKDHMMWWKERILKPQRHKNGWLRVTLTGHKSTRVHRLVALAFFGPAPFTGAVVRHLDDNPRNNVPDNLRWGTQKENVHDAQRNGQIFGGYWPKGSRRIGGVFVL